MKGKTIQLLFDLGDCEPRKTGKQSAFEKNPDCIEIMQAFAEIVDQAHKDTRAHLKLRPPMEIGRNDFSNMLNSLVTGRMCDRFPQYRIIRNGRKYLRVGGFQIYFKRLYHHHLPQHGPSESALALERNLQNKYDSTMDAVIWMGWHVSDDRSQITGKYATHQNENDRWHTDIVDHLVIVDMKRFDVKPIEGVKPKLKRFNKKKQNEQ